jgi:hypothetical protein
MLSMVADGVVAYADACAHFTSMQIDNRSIVYKSLNRSTVSVHFLRKIFLNVHFPEKVLRMLGALELLGVLRMLGVLGISECSGRTWDAADLWYRV